MPAVNCYDYNTEIKPLLCQCLSPMGQTRINKEERYSRVPRLSDTRYSKGNGDMQAAN